jgi:ankyrin repeat protein
MQTRVTRETPLHIACAGGHLTAMQYLLSVSDRGTEYNSLAGAVLNTWVAKDTQHLPVSPFLQIGVPATEGDKYGNTIVHYAAFRGQVGSRCPPHGSS